MCFEIGLCTNMNYRYYKDVGSFRYVKNVFKVKENIVLILVKIFILNNVNNLIC